MKVSYIVSAPKGWHVSTRFVFFHELYLGVFGEIIWKLCNNLWKCIYYNNPVTFGSRFYNKCAFGEGRFTTMPFFIWRYLSTPTPVFGKEEEHMRMKVMSSFSSSCSSLSAREREEREGDNHHPSVSWRDYRRMDSCRLSLLSSQRKKGRNRVVSSWWFMSFLFLHTARRWETIN